MSPFTAGGLFERIVLIAPSLISGPFTKELVNKILLSFYRDYRLFIGIISPTSSSLWYQFNFKYSHFKAALSW